jgi:hypothetical protein
MLSFRGQRHRCFGDPASRHDKMEDRRTRSSADEKSRHCRQDEPIEPFPADLCQQITGDAAGPLHSTVAHADPSPTVRVTMSTVPRAEESTGRRCGASAPSSISTDHEDAQRRACTSAAPPRSCLPPCGPGVGLSLEADDRAPPNGGVDGWRERSPGPAAGWPPVPFPYLHRQPEPGQRPDPAQAASQVAEPSVFGTRSAPRW